jgi:hypothetical protein
MQTQNVERERLMAREVFNFYLNFLKFFLNLITTGKCGVVNLIMDI